MNMHELFSLGDSNSIRDELTHDFVNKLTISAWLLMDTADGENVLQALLYLALSSVQ